MDYGENYRHSPIYLKGVTPWQIHWRRKYHSSEI